MTRKIVYKVLFMLVFLTGLFAACGTEKTETQGTESAETKSAGNTENVETKNWETEGTPENGLGLKTASLLTSENSGSCIVLSAQENRLLLATASHVAFNAGSVLINGTGAEVKEYWKSDTYDLVYIWVETKETLLLEEAELSEDAFLELQEGDQISVQGVVAGEAVLRQGKVRSCFVYMEDFGYHMLWGDVEGVQGGMSGGGVFDSKGRLVGMLCGGDGDREIAVLPVSIMSGELINSELADTIDIFSE